MTTKPKRWGRWTFVFAGIVGLIVLVGIPTAPLLRMRQQISSALRSATAIRLEEFVPGYSYPDRILTKRALTAGDYHQVIDALPICFAVGIPGFFKPCYIPHHRVVVTTPDNREITIGVCFTCHEISFPDYPMSHSIIRMPETWRESLKQLFLRHDVPVRNENFYANEPNA